MNLRLKRLRMPAALSRTFSRALFYWDGMKGRVVLETENANCDRLYRLIDGSRVTSVGRLGRASLFWVEDQV